MIGQFHPECAEPAARNPAFRVSRSPVPLVAIRFMAVHDILFLGEQANWFAQYHRRFGARHRRQSNGIDPVLTTLYYKALAVHGIPGPVEDVKGPDDSPARLEKVVQ
jgi:heptaprenyl diphosphate synthase